MPHRTLVTRWFAALAAEDWQAFWRLHTPDALLLVGPQLLPRTAIEPFYFERAMAQMAERLAGRDHPVLSLAGEPEVAGDVVRVPVREGRTGMMAMAAFVCQADGIAGMVIDPAAGVPVLAACAADLAQVPGKPSASQMYLTPLHHSFARRRLTLPGTVRALPDARFTCQGRGECCQVGKWNVLLSDNEVHAGRLLTRALDLPPLQVSPDPGPPAFNDPHATTVRRQMGSTADGACHQLDGDNHCAVHATFGDQPIPVCQTYPLTTCRTPDGWDVTSYFSCRSVCMNQGAPLPEQESAILARFWPIQHRVAQIPAVLPRVGDGATPPSVPWDIYRWLEGELLALLEGEGLVAALRAGSRILAEAMAPLPALRRATPAVIFRSLLMDLPELDAWRAGWMGGGYWQAWDAETQGRVRFEPAHEMLSRYLRTVLFRKRALEKAGVGLPWGTALLAYRMVKADACFRAGQAKRDVTDEDDLIEAMRAVDLLIGHQDLVYRLSSLAGCPLESPATWEALLGGQD
jgi:hypothetical protein